MIKESDLREAIAECQGERNPDARTCMKLAAYYTILNNMNASYIEEKPTYSRAEPSEQVRYNSGSEFSEAIRGLNIDEILDVMDELMESVNMIMPKLYRATIEKLRTK